MRQIGLGLYLLVQCLNSHGVYFVLTAGLFGNIPQSVEQRHFLVFSLDLFEELLIETTNFFAPLLLFLTLPTQLVVRIHFVLPAQCLSLLALHVHVNETQVFGDAWPLPGLPLHVFPSVTLEMMEGFLSYLLN